MNYTHIKSSKKFEKCLKKLGRATSALVLEKIVIFRQNPLSPELRLHKLKGNKAGFYSIDIAFDLRALFYIEGNIAIFTELGTHSELYG